MRSMKHVLVVVAALIALVGACGKESGDGLPAVDTVPPNPPVGLQAAEDDDLVLITWDENAEIDLAGYRLYSSSSEEGPYGEATSGLLYCPWFFDDVAPMATTYYKVTAVDESGNESAFSEIIGIYYRNDRKRDDETPL
jgi:hypothetical protein